MNRGDIRTEVLVRSGKDTTSAWTSEAIVNDWINQAYRWAAGYKKWPFTEGRQSTTYTGTEEWNFEGYKADSIRIVKVGGERFQKLNFEDYQIFKEETPNSTDKVFTDFNNTLFLNTASGASGTLTVYGQYMPATIEDGDGNDATETVFTTGNDEGNEAIVEKVLEYMSKRGTNQNEAQVHTAYSKQILDSLWEKINAEQYKYQTKDRGMFERFDVIGGEYYDDSINTNQF